MNLNKNNLGPISSPFISGLNGISFIEQASSPLGSLPGIWFDNTADKNLRPSGGLRLEDDKCMEYGSDGDACTYYDSVNDWVVTFGVEGVGKGAWIASSDWNAGGFSGGWVGTDSSMTSLVHGGGSNELRLQPALTTINNQMNDIDTIIYGDTGKVIEVDAGIDGIGFFGKAPVSQLLKASYNNWAALSDVVNALVAIGLFDQA